MALKTGLQTRGWSHDRHPGEPASQPSKMAEQRRYRVDDFDLNADNSVEANRYPALDQTATMAHTLLAVHRLTLLRFFEHQISRRLVTCSEPAGRLALRPRWRSTSSSIVPCTPLLPLVSSTSSKTSIATSPRPSTTCLPPIDKQSIYAKHSRLGNVTLVPHRSELPCPAMALMRQTLH